MSSCLKCQAALSSDEIAVYRRMLDREAKEYMCKRCLAEHFGCTEAHINKKIEQFKHVGCVLFNER